MITTFCSGAVLMHVPVAGRADELCGFSNTWQGRYCQLLASVSARQEFHELDGEAHNYVSRHVT